MTLPPPQIAFLPLARPTFDIPYATSLTQCAFAHLQKAGLNLIGTTELVLDQDQADAAAQVLRDQPVDLVILFQATFADSSMAMSLAGALEAPLLLWAVPEPHTGGRLRLNSLCGVNLAGHALKRAGRASHHLYAPPDSTEALTKINPLARAGRAKRLLRKVRIGRMGENPVGFETCELDKNMLRLVFGLEIIQLDLEDDLFRTIRQTPAEATQATWDSLDQRVQDLGALEPRATHRSLATYLTLTNISREMHIDGFAVRCWPEFFTELGCAACGALSLLNDDMIPASCETDVNGTITQLMLQWISEESVFGADIVSVDNERDAIVVWHCGKAPLSMADPQGQPSVTIHSNRRLPLLMDFTLRPGPVTIARLSHAEGKYRLVVGRGEIIGAPKSFSGTSGLLRFDSPAATILDNILDEGLEHHIALTYGDHSNSLLALAEMLEIPVLQLN